MLNWDDFRCFLATARAGSTLGAARTLGINQATVARRLDALEQALGARLFDRGQTGSKLTEVGESLLPEAEAMEVAASRASKLAASSARVASGALRVTANEITASVGLMPVLGEFRRQYPDIQVEVVVSDQMLDLAAGEADVAIRGANRMDDSNLVARKIAETPWGIYCSRGYAEANGRPRAPADIRDHAVIGPDGELVHAPAMAWMMSHADPAKVAYSSNSLNNLVPALKAGLGLAPLPSITAALEPELVTCIPPRAELPASLYAVTTEALRSTPRVRAFIDFIVPSMVGRIRTILAEAAAREAEFDRG